MGGILANPNLCSYHKVNKYNYWNIMAASAAEFYYGEYSVNGCQFRGGMN